MNKALIIEAVKWYWDFSDDEALTYCKLVDRKIINEIVEKYVNANDNIIVNKEDTE